MIVVTGGLGFIGTHVVRELLNRGEEVVATRRGRGPSSMLRDAPALRVVEMDTTDPAAWRIADGASAIVHLAAESARSDAKDGVLSAVAGAYAAVDAARRTSARLVAASTIGVYAGTPIAPPWPEDAPLAIGVAAGIPAAKKAMESLLAVASDVDVVTVRLPAVYGPLGPPSSRFFALPSIVHAAALRRPVALPVPMRASDAIDLCDVRDVARAIVDVAVLTAPTYRVYNIGTGHGTSNAQMLDAVRAARPELRLEVPWAEGEPPAPAALDVARIHEDTRWAPQVTLDEGVDFYLAWLESGEQR